MGKKYSQYLKDPIKIIDVIDVVIKKLAEQCQNHATPDQILQLNEISKAVLRLEDSGAQIPNELRKLKVDLSVVVTDHENILRTLKATEVRLSHTLTSLRAKIRQLSDRNQGKTKTRKRYVKRTSPIILRKEICRALRELGGSAKKSVVVDKIRTNMIDRFKPNDLEQGSKGILNWEKWVNAERLKLLKEGVLKAGSDQGIWELRKK